MSKRLGLLRAFHRFITVHGSEQDSSIALLDNDRVFPHSVSPTLVAPFSLSQVYHPTERRIITVSVSSIRQAKSNSVQVSIANISNLASTIHRLKSSSLFRGVHKSFQQRRLQVIEVPNID
jgi:hypothetical protein